MSCPVTTSNDKTSELQYCYKTLPILYNRWDCYSKTDIVTTIDLPIHDQKWDMKKGYYPSFLEFFSYQKVDRVAAEMYQPETKWESFSIMQNILNLLQILLVCYLYIFKLLTALILHQDLYPS